MEFTTDKVTVHGYLPFYLQRMAVLARLPHRPVIVELGVRDGSSLHMWQAMAPDALIIGVDNSLACENACPRGTRFIHAEQDHQDLDDRIAAVISDELGIWQPIDMLVDDASHIGKKTADSFLNLWHLIRNGGVYIIEDWYVGFEEWADYDSSMVELIRNHIDHFRNKPGAYSNVESLELRYGLAMFTKFPD